MTSKEILNQMRTALKEFGEYAFEDKGPDEVMAIQPIVDALKSMPAAEARTVLEEVHDGGDGGYALASYLVVSLDDQPEEWWDTLMQSEVLAELY